MNRCPSSQGSRNARGVRNGAQRSRCERASSRYELESEGRCLWGRLHGGRYERRKGKRNTIGQTWWHASKGCRRSCSTSHLCGTLKFYRFCRNWQPHNDVETTRKNGVKRRYMVRDTTRSSSPQGGQKRDNFSCEGTRMFRQSTSYRVWAPGRRGCLALPESKRGTSCLGCRR